MRVCHYFIRVKRSDGIEISVPLSATTSKTALEEIKEYFESHPGHLYIPRSFKCEIAVTLPDPTGVPTISTMRGLAVDEGRQALARAATRSYPISGLVVPEC